MDVALLGVGTRWELPFENGLIEKVSAASE
jgi:hypothetical protein